jgi:hypothetical protein
MNRVEKWSEQIVCPCRFSPNRNLPTPTSSTAVPSILTALSSLWPSRISWWSTTQTQGKSSPNPPGLVTHYPLSQRTHQLHCFRQRRQDLCYCLVPLFSFRADRTCILWKYNPDSEKKIEPVLKLTQNDAILTLAFNPLTYELFSGGASDFALFIPGRKEIPKEKFKEKIISSGWSADGQTLAFGTINGTLSFRHRNLDEKVTSF